MTQRPDFIPTLEQEAIRGAAQQRSGSVMVEAGAGCAKTSTLELAAGQIRVPALALAFNKRIATDMQGSVPSSFSVKTMNGLGQSAWARVISGASIRLDDRKLGKLVSEVARQRRVELSSEQWDGLRQLTSKAMSSGLVPSSDPHGESTLVEDTKEGWRQVAEPLDLSPDDFELVWELAREVLVEDIRLAREGVISFDDQIYCSTMLGGRFPQFPVVFVDEDQDLSPLNIRMVGQAIRPDGRLFAVGDKRQAIYAWRGAAGDSAERLRSLMPLDSWKDYPLMTTFRCPKVVVERQQSHVPLFRAWHTNPEGRVYQLPLYSSDENQQGWDWGGLTKLLPSQVSPLAVLCRNNAPLLSLAFKLLRRGIGCQMLGRDIGKGLQVLAKRILPEDGTPAESCAGRIEEWKQHEWSLARANNSSEAKIESVLDRAECLQAVLQSTECRDAGGLRQMLAKLFSRESDLITLSSIHRAKGLEWDSVVHLDPWRIGLAAKRARARGDLVQVEQEANLRYVAETRTKHTLVLANLENFR